MGKAKLSRLSGLCWQCDEKLHSTREKNPVYGDFYYLTTKGTLNVYCYRCGPTVVNSRGRCVSDCKLHHSGQTVWQKMKEWYRNATTY